MLDEVPRRETDRENKPHIERLSWESIGGTAEENKGPGMASCLEVISAVSIVKQCKNGAMLFPCTFVIYFAN